MLAARHDAADDDVYKEDLALNNLKWLMCHETQPSQIIYIYIYVCVCVFLCVCVCVKRICIK